MNGISLGSYQLIAAAAVTLASGLAAAAPPEAAPTELSWSRPVSITSTAVEAKPALVVDARDRIHLFLIDREAGSGIVRWITADLDGQIVGGPRTLGAADLRARTIAAAVDGPHIRVVWVAPSGDEMRVVSARVSDATVVAPQSLSDPVEDAGPVGMAPSAGAHIVWSQAAAGRRSVWYKGPGQSPVEVALGDAPAVSAGSAAPWIVWWHRAGFDAYRLVAASPPSGSPSISTLTGNLATSRLHAPAAAHDGAGRLHVMFGTEQRGFGPVVGRLFILDVGPDGKPSPRRLVAPGSPFAAAASAAPWRGIAAFAWTDLRSGRSRNPEIYVGVDVEGAFAERRLTYSLTASAQPVLVAGPGAALTAAWLEVAPGGRFAVHLASTARPAPRHFLLAIPELDVYRPGEAAAFALTVLIGTIPYALLMTLATALLTGASAVASRAIFGGSRAWSWLLRSEVRVGLATLALALACHRTVTALFGLTPSAPVPAVLGVLVLGWAWLSLRRAHESTILQRAALVMVVVFGVSVVLAFGQVARTLSQLST